MLRQFCFLVAAVIGLVLASSAKADTPPLALVKQIIAHRGSSADRPECTLGGVAYGAHIGGFVAGVVLAKPFMIGRKSSRPEAWRNQRRTNRMG